MITINANDLNLPLKRQEATSNWILKTQLCTVYEKYTLTRLHSKVENTEVGKTHTRRSSIKSVLIISIKKKNKL